MRRWKLLALGLGAYVLGLVATMPAAFVDAGLRHASNGRLRLAEAQGTLWSGAGQLEVLDRDPRIGVAARLSWHFRPWSMIRGQLGWEIGLGQPARSFPLMISPTRIEIAGAEISFPAGALGLGVPKLAPLGLTGDLRLQVERFSVGRNTMRGNATLQWRAAGSALTSVWPLGDYELRIEGEGSRVGATLHTLQGPLQLEGKGSWPDAGNAGFLLIARVAPQQRQQLDPLLALIAVGRGDGTFELQLK